MGTKGCVSKSAEPQDDVCGITGLQPHRHHDERDDTQDGDQAGHGFRLLECGNGPASAFSAIHLLTMLNRGKCQARETHEDHRRPDHPGTDDRVAMLVCVAQVLEELEDRSKPNAIKDVLVRIHAINVRSLARRVRSTASRVDVSSG